MIPHNRIRVLCLLILLAWTVPGRAGETRTVTVKGQAYGEGKTPEEGRRAALQNARARAAEEIGVTIASQSFGLEWESPARRFEAYSQLIRSTTRGRIVSEHLDSTWVEVLPGTTMPTYYVKLTAEIALEQGRRDPGFILEVQLNGENITTDQERGKTFRAGEELILTVKSSRPCYLTVFNVLPSDTVLVLVPSPELPERIVRPGKPLQIPPESLRRQGLHLRLEPMPGQQESAEMLLLVATKTAIPVRGTPVQTGQAALTAINRWLIDIPLDQRTGAAVLYRIVR